LNSVQKRGFGESNPYHVMHRTLSIAPEGIFQFDVTCESNPSPSESLCVLRLVEVCRGAGGERRLRVEIHSDKVYCFGDTNRPLVLFL
jgi:hypothetical protein